jgi:hypothetical protein
MVFTSSHALVDFETVRVPFTVTPFKDLEAFPDRFVSPIAILKLIPVALLNSGS